MSNFWKFIANMFLPANYSLGNHNENSSNVKYNPYIEITNYEFRNVLYREDINVSVGSIHSLQIHHSLELDCSLDGIYDEKYNRNNFICEDWEEITKDYDWRRDVLLEEYAELDVEKDEEFWDSRHYYFWWMWKHKNFWELLTKENQNYVLRLLRAYEYLKRHYEWNFDREEYTSKW